MKFVLYAILVYILYLFIFRLVIPVYLASRKIKKGLQEMQSRMQEQNFNHDKDREQGFATKTSPSKPQSKKRSDDYIDYEEVK